MKGHKCSVKLVLGQFNSDEIPCNVCDFLRLVSKYLQQDPKKKNNFYKM